ncbi:MAG: ABC transporter permease [Acidobacteria bacterium]|nr:MAG: ABC transporter permease [Acidobacteriota bacterium]
MFRIFGIRLAPAAAPLALPSQNQDVTVQFWPSNMNETFEGPFSLLQMFWGSITVRPMRSSLSVIAIAIQVILVLLIVGLTSGVVSEWGKRVEGVGADILVQPPNSSIFFAFSSAVMPESLGDQIASVKSVDEVAPTIILTEPKSLVMVYGIDYARFNALSRGFLFRDGRLFQGPDEVIADDIIAQTRHLKVGSQVTLLNHVFTVSGIVAHGKGARFFIPIRTAQEIAGAERRVSMFYVRSKGDTGATRAQLAKLLPQYSIRSLAEYVSLMNSSNLPQLRPFTRTMVALGIVISFIVVLLNMHTMVMERTREIGILKALGFSRFDIVRMLLTETFILTILGTGLGVGLTFLTQVVLKEVNPGLTVLISPNWIFAAIMLALAGAAAGALYPALRAATYDPVVALAYE